MARKKLSTTIYITEEQNERLKSLHQKTRVPVAEYIRQGIDLILDKNQGQLPGQLNLYPPPSMGGDEGEGDPRATLTPTLSPQGRGKN
ncbi:MAG: ribbon-helix-helix domain-containing protein [Deltaproteobacteria bacterium]|nr:ribbon-helix-helix domain-containing protein [Deltaproteobacteria bacterium]